MKDPTAIGVLIVVIGLAVILAPLTFFSYHEPRYHIRPVQVAQDQRTGESVVMFDSLSEIEQAAVNPYQSPWDTDYSSVQKYLQPKHNHRILTADQWEAADGLRQHEFVAHDGAYRIEVNQYRATWTSPLASWSLLVGAAGIAILAVGAFVIRHGSVRSLTPTRAAVIPLASIPLLLIGAWLLTFSVSHDRIEPLPHQGLLLGAITWPVMGSALATRDRHWAIWIGGVLIAITVTKWIFDPYSMMDVVGAMALIGIPFGGLGFLFSASPDRTDSTAV